MCKQLHIGLVSHLIRDTNLGCCALAISNIAILDELFRSKGIDVVYRVVLAEGSAVEDLRRYTSLSEVTDNPFEVKTYPRPRYLLRHPSSLSRSDAFEGLDYLIDLCGGDGYTDNYGMIRLFAESVPVLGATQQECRVIFSPQTIGPFNTMIGKMVAKWILGKLDTLFVRDTASMYCCNELGLRENVCQVVDIAFSLPYERILFQSNKKMVGVNVSGLLYSGGYDCDNYFNLSFDYSSFIDKLIDRLSANEDYKVVLVPHVINEGDPIDDDWKICNTIASRYVNVDCAPKFSSPIEAKSYIAGLDFFTGARMHATIAAFSAGVPVVPVAYSRKFNGLYDMLHYQYYIDARGGITEEEAISKIEYGISNSEVLQDAQSNAKRDIDRLLDLYRTKLADALNL